MADERQQRMTIQRKLILEVLQSTTSHPTADWIYEEVRKKLPRVSLGTVYRNLNVLKENGEVLELNYGSGQSRYDGNPKNHYHFTCQICGAVYDVPFDVQNELNERAKEASGFVIYKHRLEFYGMCNECQNSH